MLKPRIIPCLLLRDGGLVKTVQFRDAKYVGDPLNAVRIFNEKEVDELIVLDIDASVQGREPDYSLIKNLAAECRMPLCYGGGVKTPEQITRLVSLGVEKVALSSVLFSNPDLIPSAVERVGSQSIVAVLDVKREKGGSYALYSHNGAKAVSGDAIGFAKALEALGAGEVVVNSIDRDGTMQGYDLDMVRAFRDVLGIPMTALGGAGSLEHLSRLLSEFEVIGAAAGSFFVFKGVYRAVLISYPGRQEREQLGRLRL